MAVASMAATFLLIGGRADRGPARFNSLQIIDMAMTDSS